MEDEEFKKLPIEEKCVHKLWKTRVNGYEEVTKLFRHLDDEKSPEYSKYLGLVKKFVTDSNALAQEKGLEATLAYVENYGFAGKTVSEVMSGIVMKCIAAPKLKTRDLALQIILMYIEIEKQEAVLEELLKGTEQKNPKITAACIQALTTALREFGIKIVSPKPILKKIGVLFSDRDKAVRDEARLMVIELYRWIGPGLRAHLQNANLQAVQLTELETEFLKIDGTKSCPLRYVRSQQQKQSKLMADAEEVDGADDEDNEEDAPKEIDPYDLADPVNILSKLPKDFYEKIEAKKWQERKDVLEIVENLLKSPKLENGDYGDLVRALKKVVQKDSNVICVAMAARCIAGLAAGLKRQFQIYSVSLVSTLLEKFKEKKQNVLTALRDAIDGVYLTTNIEAILEDVLEALNNKNPSVKSETSLFLARAFTKTLPRAITKKHLKAVVGVLVKNLNEPDPTVRESTAETLGTLMKLVGEKAIGPFLVEIEKDTLKMNKVREYYEKAVISVKVAATKKAPIKTDKAKEGGMDKAGFKAPAVPKKKPSVTNLTGTATIVKCKGVKAAPKPALKIEKELDDVEVDSIVEDLFPSGIVSELVDSVWKTRLVAAEQIISKLRTMDGNSIPTQAIVKTVMKKPGLKDTNFQVLKVKLDIVKYLAENGIFSTTTVDCCVNDICDKIADVKNGPYVAETLTAMADATNLGHVSTAVLETVFSQRSPKLQQEALNWLLVAVKEFGISNLNVKLIIENSKKALSSTNPGVRQSSISFLGILYLYMGSSLYVFFENEKPSLRDQIVAEFDKYKGQNPPAPTRGVPKSASSNSLDALEDEAGEVNIQDLLPRADISGKITDSLINELGDKNWKERIEALNKVNSIIQEAKFIKPNLGDLPQALAARLSDSNVKIAQTTLNICQEIVKAVGPESKQYIRTFFPGFLQCLSDNKAWMRTTALETINAYSEKCGYKEFFDCGMIGDAFKTGSPVLRAELWNWLAEVLPKIPPKTLPKEEIVICVPHLFSNLEDRNADVRKNANEAILGIMIHARCEEMIKQAEKLKPGSKAVVLAALDKVRPNLPMKKSQPVEEKPTKSASQQRIVKPKAGSTQTKASAPVSSRKKEEEVDTSPLLVTNNLKHQRTIDESKLKVLRWNFTQPREEFVELLKDQMLAANVNKQLIANMFHSDFRFHIKAIESLMEDLPNNSQALISNLDLILKWLTLRFFDTNPSVLLKGLEYLHSVFNTLVEKQYHMLENEGSCFIPYLVLKVGDPKDAVRNGVRSLLKQISGVFPLGRLSGYVMEGVKSKNARQRAECLEIMGSMIEDYGISVCMPSPSAVLKEVAKQISDRDNSVRNAALNCVVQAYNIVGDKVYKMVGNISDKDMSLLEERIKRSSRRSIMPKAAPTLNVTITQVAPTTSNGINGNETVTIDDDQDVDDEDTLPGVRLPPAVASEPPKKVVHGPFQLDPEFMKELDKITINYERKPIMEIDTNFMNEDIKMPSFYDNKAKIMPMTPPKPVQAMSYAMQGVKHGISVEISETLKLVGTPNLAVGCQGFLQLLELMNNPSKSQVLADHENDFVEALVSQLKHLRTLDPGGDETVAKLYRSLFRSIDMFYQQPRSSKRVTVQAVKDLMNQLVSLLVEQKLESCGDVYVRVLNLNCVRIIENSDHTVIICALVKLIKECVADENCSERQVELVMKCIWKVIKLMPNWGHEFDYELVLVEVHEFLVKFPSKWWIRKPADTPLRTIKTIIHLMVKIKGPAVTQLLSKISNLGESEIEAYILKLLKTLKIAQAQEIPVQSQRKSLSRANHNMLTEIFQKIGSKEETKEGLNLLYDFIQQYPEADIEPFLSKSSKFFQDYIRKGLKEIEDARKITNLAHCGN
ncbi:protein mini spindles isoform X2 [Cylas formicarius]|uniref:protein mini spindles isoform X2 n=1 Tax=Cylas formicarius TaxID=197179 RepID=UPI002958D5BA|nr:protein mini spindles isoform X2 [Cylas formicarius]